MCMLQNRAVPSLHNFKVTSKTILKSFVVFRTRTSILEPHFSNNRSLLLDYLIEDLLSYYLRGSTVASRVGKRALKADAIERKESEETGGNKVKPDLTLGD
ncbi:hypothetical protein PIB30_027857 [Stylosanthes scabra]|uniref:Uncharacterized protein n=1 Tax=Stylosanthes scabra TaxID=79078 RepID=A0ABU6VBP1_9FABA|nr:hypothetical protein [Stylosanthes scabra]